ncbi:MAG: T9SS type A sorting domain-containing protein [Bacteroidota bacterium]|nr:T9SS type A sorting domain-containing protein [Bacteroidota bacterium]
MKKKITFSICLLFGVIMINDLVSNQAISNSGSAPAGNTGSPADGKNCTNCHAGTSTLQQNLITSNIPIDGYKADSTYSITATVSHPTFNKFGFQVSPQNINGNLLGTLIVINTTETQLTGLGKYITHNSGGTTGTSNTKSWTFNWIAPSSGTGDVTFYGAFNAANNNSQTSGDEIYTSTLTIQENISTYIASTDTDKIFTVYPNPVNDKITVSFENTVISSPKHITIRNIEGKEVRKIISSEMSNQEIDVSNLKAGIYFLTFMNNENVYVKKIIKN